MNFIQRQPSKAPSSIGTLSVFERPNRKKPRAPSSQSPSSQSGRTRKKPRSSIGLGADHALALALIEDRENHRYLVDLGLFKKHTQEQLIHMQSHRCVSMYMLSNTINDPYLPSFDQNIQDTLLYPSPDDAKDMQASKSITRGKARIVQRLKDRGGRMIESSIYLRSTSDPTCDKCRAYLERLQKRRKSVDADSKYALVLSELQVYFDESGRGIKRTINDFKTMFTAKHPDFGDIQNFLRTRRTLLDDCPAYGAKSRKWMKDKERSNAALQGVGSDQMMRPGPTPTKPTFSSSNHRPDEVGHLEHESQPPVRDEAATTQPTSPCKVSNQPPAIFTSDAPSSTKPVDRPTRIASARRASPTSDRLMGIRSHPVSPQTLPESLVPASSRLPSSPLLDDAEGADSHINANLSTNPSRPTSLNTSPPLLIETPGFPEGSPVDSLTMTAVKNQGEPVRTPQSAVTPVSVPVHTQGISTVPLPNHLPPIDQSSLRNSPSPASNTTPPQSLCIDKDASDTSPLPQPPRSVHAIPRGSRTHRTSARYNKDLRVYNP